jgi:hypothetical protein
MRFHISTYALRLWIDLPENSPTPTTTAPYLVTLAPPELTALINKSFEAAAKCLTFFTDIDPLALETSRYVELLAFEQTALVCLYLIMASEAFCGLGFAFGDHLGLVQRIGRGMKELSVESHGCPQILAEAILARLHAAGRGQPSPQKNVFAGTTASYSAEVSSQEARVSVEHQAPTLSPDGIAPYHSDSFSNARNAEADFLLDTIFSDQGLFLGECI